jgi:hypothetical protein
MLARAWRRLLRFDARLICGVILTVVAALSSLLPVTHTSDNAGNGSPEPAIPSLRNPWEYAADGRWVGDYYQSTPGSIEQRARELAEKKQRARELLEERMTSSAHMAMPPAMRKESETKKASKKSASSPRLPMPDYRNSGNTFPGLVAVSNPPSMRVGDDIPVRARISREGAAELLAGLGDRGNIKQTGMDISRLLRVNLIGNDRFFEITPLSTSDQLVLDKSYTEWTWNVRPKRTGREQLYLRVSVRMMDPLYGPQYKDSRVGMTPITVTTTAWHESQRIAGENWRWALGTTTPAAVLVASFQYLRKRRNASSRHHRQRGGRHLRPRPPGRLHRIRRHSTHALGGRHLRPRSPDRFLTSVATLRMPNDGSQRP